MRWDGAPHEWVSAKSLFGLASPRAQDLGAAQWVRRAPLAGRLVLICQPRHGRMDRSLAGPARRSRLSRAHAQRAREPWLLVASPSLDELNARQLVRAYKTRMQIEEGFRDTKSAAYGLGVANGRYTALERAANLLLITALAAFVLWLIGCLAKNRQWQSAVQVQSARRRTAYSTLFLARLVIRHLKRRLPRDCLKQANRYAAEYLDTVMAATN